jgi:hypothetical protein
MLESRRATAPDGPPHRGLALPRAAITAWWLLMLGSTALTRVGFDMQQVNTGDTLQSAQDAVESARTGLLLDMVTGGLTVLAAGLCMFIVWRLTLRQRERILAARAADAPLAATA